MEGHDELRVREVQEAPQCPCLWLAEGSGTRVILPRLPLPVVRPIPIQIHTVGVLTSVYGQTVWVDRRDDPEIDPPNHGVRANGIHQSNAGGFITMHVSDEDGGNCVAPGSYPVSEKWAPLDTRTKPTSGILAPSGTAGCGDANPLGFRSNCLPSSPRGQRRARRPAWVCDRAGRGAAPSKQDERQCQLDDDSRPSDEAGKE